MSSPSEQILPVGWQRIEPLRVPATRLPCSNRFGDQSFAILGVASSQGQGIGYMVGPKNGFLWMQIFQKFDGFLQDSAVSQGLY